MSLAAEHLEKLKADGYALATREKRGAYLRGFLRWLAREGIEDPREATREVMERYALGFVKRRTPQRFRAVRGFFRWMARSGRMLMDPSGELVCKPSGRRLPEDIREGEMEALLNMPDVETPLGLRDRAVMELLYSTGIRRRELARLNVGDVDMREGVLFVREGKTRRDRVVPVGKTALYWLERYLRAGRRAQEEKRRRKAPGSYEGGLFLSRRGWGWNATGVSWTIKRYGERCGLAKAATCYRIRHSCATHLVRGGANIVAVQKLLGHADLRTTQIYTHVAPVELKEAHRRSHPRG